MMAAHAKQRNLLNGSIVTAGSANAQTFFSGLDYTVVPTGLRVLLRIGPSLTNTTTATLNMDNIGAVAIKTMVAADLAGGELVADAYAEFCYNGTNWILLHYAKPLGMKLLSSQTASNSPGIAFTSGITSEYDEYMIVLSGVYPMVADTVLMMQLSTDNGANWITSASYSYVITALISTTTTLVASEHGAIAINIMAGMQPNSLAGAYGEVRMMSPWRVAINPIEFWASMHTGTALAYNRGVGVYGGATAMNAILFVPSSGNIGGGSFQLYGLRK